jgi:hypothetical protein
MQAKLLTSTATHDIMSFLNVALFGDALKNDRLPGFEL